MYVFRSLFRGHISPQRQRDTQISIYLILMTVMETHTTHSVSLWLGLLPLELLKAFLRTGRCLGPCLATSCQQTPSHLRIQDRWVSLSQGPSNL